MKVIRFILGRMILGINCVFSPSAMQRNAQDQQQVDLQTNNLKLYQFHACPFCVKIRRVIKRLNLNIELRDALANPIFAQELLEQGGKRQVPCLLIINADGSNTWLYESKAISLYLEQNFNSISV